jgi:hypothetical protein
MIDQVAIQASEHRGSNVPLRVFLAVILVAAALVAAFLVGTIQHPVSIRSGTAHSAEGAISIEGADGWFYGVPLDGVEWIDSKNAWHDSGRPGCLPPTGTTNPVRFGSVDVTVEASSWRAVVWVDCR